MVVGGVRQQTQPSWEVVTQRYGGNIADTCEEFRPEDYLDFLTFQSSFIALPTTKPHEPRILQKFNINFT